MDVLHNINIKYQKARYNLMFMIILSIINFFYLLIKEEFYLPFSSSLSSYPLILGIRASKDLGSSVFLTIGITFACIALALYLVCYFKSKSNGFFLFMSMTVFAADTIALIIITLIIQSFQLLTFLDILLHFMTLYFLYSGVKADRDIKKFKAENEFLYNAADSNISEEEFAEEDYESKKVVLISGNFNNYKVVVSQSYGRTELSVDGNACDTLETDFLSEYELLATVDDVEFYFQYKRDFDGLTMFLYADDILLDSITTD